jgi:hypothetical protein
VPADPPLQPDRRGAGPARLSALLIALITIAAGAIAAVHYARLGLALAHHDARAHLVVARRVLDSLTPGWQQVGAVWLPLPHLLNLFPVQVDAWYRTGASAIAISVLSMGLAAWALARFVLATTGSASAAAAGAALLMCNPNILYLQSTPMTEPLLIGTCLLAVQFTGEWIAAGAPLPPRRAGWAIVAACMTRYEAWPVCAALIAGAGAVLVRRGTPPAQAVRACLRLSAYPVAALVLFSANSRWTTGTWLLQSGFFVPENPALGNPGLALDQVRQIALDLSGAAWMFSGVAAAVLVAAAFVTSARRAGALLILAMAAAAALPWYAFYEGHPVRVRYGVPLVAAAAAIAATGIGLLWRPLRPVAAALVVSWALADSRPFDMHAPMVVESERDGSNGQGRATVTAYLREHWDGTTVMMSMGSLAHYMHDLGALGMNVRDFLHEGNEHLWLHAATYGPRGLVRWVVIEEQAEGGDALYHAARRDPSFLDGYERVADGGGVALYRAALK